MSNIRTQKWLLDRRHVLRGMGATIALPMLDCMRPLTARAAESGSTSDRPRRSVFIYIPNGVNTLTWQIQQAGRDYQLTEPLRSLERHRDVITPISGLHHPDVLGKHHNCDKVWLTGANVPADGGAFRNSVSADQLMAEVQGVHTRFASVEIAITGGSLAWSREGIQLPAERRPRTLFDRLFGVEAGGKDQARRKLNRTLSVLDTVLGDADSLRKNMGNSDRNKLDEYLTAVRQVEVRTQRAEGWLDVPKPEIDAKTKAHLGRNIDQKEAGDYYRTIYDLMVLALRTDMTRVITCMTGSESHGLAIPEIGIVQTRHELSHHNGDPEQMRRLTQTDTFLIEQFSYFLDQLKSHTDGDEPLLDSTQVLWGSGMAYGHSHGNANLPLILAGGKSLGARHGEHLDFNLPKIGQYDMANAKGHYQLCSRPVDADARLSNLLLTMLQRAGVETDSFYDSLTTLS
ncbi:MAG: DUF1552 domain-containing protein [Planctomycetales bacterium]|nr:DUF1552 domain-containing protein [Planctomycetales bacterium]